MAEEVQINSVLYPTYASVPMADEYLAANFLATAWFDMSTDQKGQLLVTATRLFDRQCWIGEKTDPDQVLQWPRTGIDGVDDTTIPTDVANGSIEMALAILDGNEAVNSSNPGAQKLRSLGAGSVNLQWFRNAEGIAARFNRFPLPVQELIGKWLCASQGVGGVIVSGDGGISVTEDQLGYNEGI